MSATDDARVFLVDDHPVVRMGFRALLDGTEHFTVAGEADAGEEALEKIAALSPDERPDLVLVDIAMPGMNGIELTRRLKQSYSEMRVVIVSMHDDSHYVEEALAAGADGYVLKDNIDDLMLVAARAVLSGGLYLCHRVRSLLGR